MKFKIKDEITRQAVVKYLQAFDIKRPLEVEIRAVPKIRSVPQNRLYWLYVNCIAEFTGDTPKRMHQALGDEYLPKVEVELGNKTKQVTMSTTELTTIQMSAYIERLIIHGAELGLVMPDPADLLFEQFYDQYNNYI